MFFGILKEPFNDYSSLLPNDSAWATNLKYTNKEKQIKPYTNCTAIDNGWVWNIPSWNKIGTGYVYSSSFVSDDNALKEFTKYLGHENLDFKKIKMRVGIHNRIFVKNVCAIGLSAGFIEPLESNGLLSVHEFLMKLKPILKRKNISQWDRDTFNVSCKEFFDQFAEFVAYHYALSHRRDTPYWKAINEKSFYDNRIIDTELKQNMYALNNRDQYFRSDTGAHYISTGMNAFAVDVVDEKLPEEIKKFLLYRDHSVYKYSKICQKQETFFNYLKNNIHNKD